MQTGTTIEQRNAARARESTIATPGLALPGFRSEMMRDIRGAQLHAWVGGDPPGVAERLAVGDERAFLEWFCIEATATRSSIEPSTVGTYLRTSAGQEGVLGAMGVVRAAFVGIAQTEPLTKAKIRPPVIPMGGVKELGGNVGTMVKVVAENVEAVTLQDIPSCLRHRLRELAPDSLPLARFVQDTTLANA